MSKRAIILAGGKGTRLKPYTVVLPKPLMPIGEYPILEVIIRQLVRFGFTHITMAVNHQAEIIKAFFGDGLKWGVKIDYSLEDNIKTFKFIMPPHFLYVALQARSDWQKHLLDDKLIKLELMKARKQLMPDIRLSVTAKKYFDEYETIAGDLNQNINWNVGLSYNTAFDFSREENALARQIIRNREHERNRAQLKRTIIQEIDDAIDNLNLAQDRTMIATERLLQSEKAVELSKLRFERGLSNNLDLVEAENAYQASNIDVLNQTIQVNLSKVLLAEKLGILDIKWLENALNIK